MPGSFGAQIASKRAPNIAGNVGASPLGRWETKCLEIFGPKLPSKQPLILQVILGPTCLEALLQHYHSELAILLHSRVVTASVSRQIPFGVSGFDSQWSKLFFIRSWYLLFKSVFRMCSPGISAGRVIAFCTQGTRFEPRSARVSDLLWTCFEVIVDWFRTTFGLVSDWFQTTFGPLLDRFGTTFGLLLD